MGRTTSFIAFGCVHAPHHSRKKRDALVRRIKEHKPDYVICLGDLMDADAASRWPSEADHTLEDEFEQASDYLDRVAKASRRAKHIWLLGNHDNNIIKPDPRRVPRKLRSLCDWNRHATYGPSFHAWRQIPYTKRRGGCLELGQVVFYHGFDIGSNSEQNEALQFNNYTGGAAHRLFVRAHTHRPHPPAQMHVGKIPVPYWTANVGTMADTEKLEYMRQRDTSLWLPGVLYGEVELGRSCQPGVHWDVIQLEI